MSKGKYAARAANREARLDDESMAEKVSEIAALRVSLAELERVLAEARVSRLRARCGLGPQGSA